jgi:hypothetical protein
MSRWYAPAPSHKFKVGDRLRAKEAIYEHADDYSPGGFLCSKGDLLIVRGIDWRLSHPLAVSHETVLDKSFRVDLDEVVPDGVSVPAGETFSRKTPMPGKAAPA